MRGRLLPMRRGLLSMRRGLLSMRDAVLSERLVVSLAGRAMPRSIHDADATQQGQYEDQKSSRSAVMISAIAQSVSSRTPRGPLTGLWGQIVPCAAWTLGSLVWSPAAGWCSSPVAVVKRLTTSKTANTRALLSWGGCEASRSTCRYGMRTPVCSTRKINPPIAS